MGYYVCIFTLLFFSQLEALDETDSGASASQKVADCTLDKPTQQLMKLIFDNDMFKEQMTKFELGKFLLHSHGWKSLGLSPIPSFHGVHIMCMHSKAHAYTPFCMI